MNYTIQDKDLETIIRTLQSSDPLNQYTVDLRQDLIKQYNDQIKEINEKESGEIKEETKLKSK